MIKLYDDWASYLGRTLCVRTPKETCVGVMIGLQRIKLNTHPASSVGLPWALATFQGLLYFDPDNPAIQLSGDDIVIKPAAAKSNPSLEIDLAVLRQKYTAKVGPAASWLS